MPPHRPVCQVHAADREDADWEAENEQLLYAADNGDWELVAALAERGVPVDPLSYRYLNSGSGEESAAYPTPLVWAVDAGNLDVVRMLLAHGADPNLRVEEGFGDSSLPVTPLSLALFGPGWPEELPPGSINHDIVAALVAAGANPDYVLNLWPNHFPDFALLHWAALADAAEAIELLAANGADLEVRGSRGGFWHNAQHCCCHTWVGRMLPVQQPCSMSMPPPPAAALAHSRR